MMVDCMQSLTLASLQRGWTVEPLQLLTDIKNFNGHITADPNTYCDCQIRYMAVLDAIAKFTVMVDQYFEENL